MKPILAFLALTLVILLSAFLAMAGIKPPAAAPVDSPADRFSAQRALQHLERIAQAPRPSGSAAHAQARTHIVAALTDLGLTPELQETTVVRPPGRRTTLAGRMINIVARRPGREPGKAVLLVAHYGTVPNSPGAGDDGSGVVALLETLRALNDGPPLRNDVIALFTDGEEIALLGARAFVDEHPWAAEVGVVLNFEARGSRGPTLMFETSKGNGPLIKALRAVPDPVAFSYSYEVYRRLPNDTDFTVFRRAGLPGLNFAFIDNPSSYHTAQDNLQRLDLGSLQQMGDSALGLARYLGDADLEAGWHGVDANYFNLGPFFFSFLGVWVPPLTVLVALAVIALLGFNWRRLSLRGLCLAMLAHLLGGLVVLVLLAIGSSAAFPTAYNFMLWGGHSSSALLLLALALVAIGLTLFLYRLAAKRIASADHIGAGLLLWTVLTTAISALLAPGACYLFTLPLLFSTSAAALWLRHDGGPGQAASPELPPALFAVLAVAAAVTTLLWVPTLVMFGQALGQGAAAAIGLFVFLLLATLQAPALRLMSRRVGWIATLGALVSGIALLLAVRLTVGFDNANRRPDCLFYALDLEAGEAQWLSYDQNVDPWTTQYLSARPERTQQPIWLGPPRPVLAHAAPLAPVSGAEVTTLDDESVDDETTHTLLIRWPTLMQRATIYLHADAAIRSLTLDGKPMTRLEKVGSGETPYRLPLLYYAPPSEGIRLEVELADDVPLTLTLVGQRHGLPALPEVAAAPRPSNTMPTYSWHADSTFVRNVITVSRLPTAPQPDVESSTTTATSAVP